MFLVVGLGNPGEKFQNTRHNIGRLVVNSWQLASCFSDFRLEKRLNALISKGVLDKKQIILALPETYMNNSGKVVKLLIKWFLAMKRINPAMVELLRHNLLVIHDDIDLPLGTIRISIDRGAAGHKGIESIIKELGTKNFTRVRIGIIPEKGKPKNVEKFVLQRFNKKEEKTIQEVIEKSCLIIEMIIKEGTERTHQKYQ